MTKELTPEVTVLMTVYNGMPFLEDAVDSILRQSLSNFRFLVIDDGSIDGGREYLDGLTDPRIQIVHQSNCGQGAARNAGIRLCQTEFIAIMDADDISLPWRLARQAEFLRSHEDVGIVGTQFVFLGARGKTGFQPPLACDHVRILADLLRGRHAMCNSSMMCRTSILKSLGGYRVAGCGEDWDLFLRMGEVAQLTNLDEVLLCVRVHSGSSTAKNMGLVRTRAAYARLCANRRAIGLQEITFEQFSAERRARPFWRQAFERADWYAALQYRRGLRKILDSRPLEGYTRIAWAAMCSPPRMWQRVWRASRKVLLRLFSAWSFETIGTTFGRIYRSASGKQPASSGTEGILE